jgi:hypothetical protein
MDEYRNYGIYVQWNIIYIFINKYYLHINKSEMSFAVKWKEFKVIILSKISQAQNVTCVLSNVESRQKYHECNKDTV